MLIYRLLPELENLLLGFTILAQKVVAKTKLAQFLAQLIKLSAKIGNHVNTFSSRGKLLRY